VEERWRYIYYMSAAEITTGNVVSFLKKKMIKKDYGSVTLYLQDGKITKVTEDNTFNPSSFIASAENKINTLMVKTYKQKVGVDDSSNDEKNPTEADNVD